MTFSEFKRASINGDARAFQCETIMPKQKRTGTKTKTKSRRRNTGTPSADVRENPVVPHIEIDEQPLGGETILALNDSQPLLGTASGAAWDYVPDPQVVDVLQETERVETAGNDFAKTLHVHNSESPELSGGDMDADWERANDVGEEAVGGTVPTPDQDVVDELGAAVGVVYQDDEPLKTEEKLQKRDRDRWELNPASKDETEQ